MASRYTHYDGDTIPMEMVLLQADGVPYDLTDCEVYVSVNLLGACVEHQGDIHDPLTGRAFFDVQDMGLPVGRHSGTIKVQWSDGLVETADVLILNILEAC